MSSDFKFKFCLVLLLTAMFALLVKNIYGKEKAISLQVYPRITLVSLKGQTQVRVNWHIAKHPDNRHLSLSWTSSEGESGSTLQDMEGENSAINYQKFITVTAGLYVFEACVYQPQRICDRVEVTVMGG